MPKKKAGKLNSCEYCRLHDICIPFGLDTKGMEALDNLVTKNQIFQKKEILFKENTPFHSLYIIRSGCVKTYCSSGSNLGRITGFFLTGEILGLESIHAEHYQDTAIALDTISVCNIQINHLLSIANTNPSIQKQLLRLMSEKINYNMHQGVRGTSVDKRIANFILSLSVRFKRSGASSTCFIVPISKKDIADYLGIATETLSRVLTKLQENKILFINHKEFKIFDLQRLQELACGETI